MGEHGEEKWGKQRHMEAYGDYLKRIFFGGYVQWGQASENNLYMDLLGR